MFSNGEVHKTALGNDRPEINSNQFKTGHYVKKNIISRVFTYLEF